MPIASLIPANDEFCVLRSQVVDTLLACRDGDGALLYLYLVRRGSEFSEQDAMRELGLTRDRYDRAVHTLTSLHLVHDQTQDRPRQQAEDDTKPPRYTVAEMGARREGDHRFASVCTTAEEVLGRTLTENQMRTLMTAYEFLKLPADVLVDMLIYLKREKGLVSRMDIEKEAALWADMGIFSVEQEIAFLARREEEKPLVDAMMRALDMAGREPTPYEYRIMSAWIRQGFDVGAVELAKERTYQRIGGFSWKYIRGILKGWHEKNVHTVSEITAIEPDMRASNHTAAVPQNPAENSSGDGMQDWEREWLKEFEAMKQEEHTDGI